MQIYTIVMHNSAKSQNKGFYLDSCQLYMNQGEKPKAKILLMEKSLWEKLK